jgi:hypothetical protein
MVGLLSQFLLIIYINLPHTHMKYCESKEEVKEDTDFGVIQIEQKIELKFIWEKRRKRERD